MDRTNESKALHGDFLDNRQKIGILDGQIEALGLKLRYHCKDNDGIDGICTYVRRLETIEPDKNAKPEVKNFLKVGDAKKLNYKDNSFDLVISITTAHNLDLKDCKEALREMERVSKKHKFLTVDAYSNEKEKELMYSWNLTAKTILHTNEWKNLFLQTKYTGDFYWFKP